tara:strand:+ start:4091 stop:4306 length:216 start_codon:yes stop_codon:yes gene_type:complete
MGSMSSMKYALPLTGILLILGCPKKIEEEKPVRVWPVDPIRLELPEEDYDLDDLPEAGEDTSAKEESNEIY